MRTFKYYLIKLKRFFINRNNTPESMARGIALGVFVGMTPSVGIQTALVLFLAVYFRASKILAILFTYVTNPLTVIPIYGLSFYLGTLVLPNLEGASFSKIKDILLDFSIEKVAYVGLESIVVIWTGGVIIALPAGILSYFVFYQIILFYRRKVELRKAIKKKILSTASILKNKHTHVRDKDLSNRNNSGLSYSDSMVSSGEDERKAHLKVKEELRRKFLTERQTIRKNQKASVEEWGGKICSHLKEYLENLQFNSIMFYYPHTGEASLLPLMKYFCESSVVLFPRVEGENMVGVAVQSESDLTPGFKNIKEPQGKCFEGDIDVILIPGISFFVVENKKRCDLFRLGYGGGYYDRFLQSYPRSHKIGVFFEFQKTDIDFHESHDISLDVIFTESERYETLYL